MRTFAPGETLKTISVAVLDNFFTNFGAAKKFYVGLTTPDNAILSYNLGQATIVENDVSISITDASAGRDTLAGLVFEVRLSAASDMEVSVVYATDNGSASATDFVAANGTLTFAPGEISKLIHVELAENEPGVDKPAAYMIVNLSSAQNANIRVGQAVGTIEGETWRVNSKGTGVVY